MFLVFGWRIDILVFFFCWRGVVFGRRVLWVSLVGVKNINVGLINNFFFSGKFLDWFKSVFCLLLFWGFLDDVNMRVVREVFSFLGLDRDLVLFVYLVVGGVEIGVCVWMFWFEFCNCYKWIVCIMFKF